jgi:MFS family permease
MGLLGTLSAIGTALGPSLGGALIAAFGWPAIFFINVPLGILASDSRATTCPLIAREEIWNGLASTLSACCCLP